MGREISERRKTVHHLGLALMVLGFLLFASNFVCVATSGPSFGAPDGMMLRAIGGMALIVVGGFLRVVGARGLAGSGVVLDPERARDELEPYSRMAGGMLSDALDEAGLRRADRDPPREADGAPPTVVVKLKCRACGFLNEDDSKFCQECGERI